MKTPQEEAEILLGRCIISWASKPQGMAEVMRNELVLPELIAVARAAAKVDLANSECTCGCFMYLGDTLQALRATGKVEL